MNRWFAPCAALALAVVGVAHAQSNASSSGFALDRFNPAERGSDFFELDTLDIRGNMRPASGLTLDLGYKPLVVYNADGSERYALVKEQLFGHLGASLVLIDRLRLGLNIPVAILQAGENATVNDVAYAAASKAALGDPRIGADYLIYGKPGDIFQLAAGVQVFLPIGNQDQYDGDGKIRIMPRVLVAGQRSIFQYAAQVAVLYRAQDSVVDNQKVGSGVDFGVGGGVRPIPDLLIGPELYGNTSFNAFFDGRTTPFEAVLGAHYQLGDYKLGLGAGPGLSHGFGSPKVRGLFSFEYAPRFKEAIHDRDGDGIPDEQDACPDQKGQPSPDARANGCPDTDADGIVDPLDACPSQPGVASSDPAKNGCPPPPPDRDGDGIADEKDACPDVKGAPSFDPKKNGCPPDLDGDGVPDSEDACIDVPGVKTADPKTNGCPGDRDHDGVRDDLDACPDVPGLPELKGCPDKDTDGDGVPDRVDNCPTEKGPKENAGCPLKNKQLVVITKEKLEIKDKVYFDTGKATIQKKSFELLNQVAKVINEHPAISGVRIEGHTDNQGSAELNRKLSQARAESVKTYLTGKGVDAKRLDAKGFGPDRPIDTNKTANGRANNRRVEFVIVNADGTTSDSLPAAGEGAAKPAAAPEKPAEKAPAKGKKPAAKKGKK